MKAKVVETTTTTRITVDLFSQDGELDVQRARGLFRPVQAVATMADGELVELKISGNMLRSDGKMGLASKIYFWDYDIDRAPAWVQQIWKGLMSGRTQWPGDDK